MLGLGFVVFLFTFQTGYAATGIMLGFTTYVLGRLVAGEFEKLNTGVVMVTIVLLVFYLGCWAI